MSSRWSTAAQELIRHLEGGSRELNLTELAAAAELNPDFVQRYWQLMGLPVTDPEEPAFTASDVESLKHLGAVMDREHLDRRTMATIIRSVGHSMDRLALWQFEALVDHMLRLHEVEDPEARLKVLEELDRVAPALEEQLVHAWRRQMAALTGRISVEFGGALPDSEIEPVRDGGELPLPRAVGFADIVAFTRLTASLRATEFTDFIQAFEARARDIVTANGGRVVKTVGDALLFIADDVETGARVALGLAQAAELSQGDEITGIAGRPVRVSLVWGRVLSRFGDVFGPPVNLASRLTDQAEPSTVLMDPGTARLLQNNPAFELQTLQSHDLPGLGELTPVQLFWARQ